MDSLHVLSHSNWHQNKSNKLRGAKPCVFVVESLTFKRTEQKQLQPKRLFVSSETIVPPDGAQNGPEWNTQMNSIYRRATGGTKEEYRYKLGPAGHLLLRILPQVVLEELVINTRLTPQFIPEDYLLLYIIYSVTGTSSSCLIILLSL